MKTILNFDDSDDSFEKILIEKFQQGKFLGIRLHV